MYPLPITSRAPRDHLHRRHAMPFGAEVLAGGGVRFRLWAPAAQRVDLCLPDTAPEPMWPMGGKYAGWFERITTAARRGSRYRFRIDGEHQVPDPASRHQPEGVHGWSEVVDPESWNWSDGDWYGRSWEKAVIYELHIGTFTPEGTFRAAVRKLRYLVELGITAIELMPVAEFPGHRDWGYDGTLPFAPESTYGSPGDLKYLVQTAHELGLMVFLDVVYNHFGPEGNYLHLYAPDFFTAARKTPWGEALAFDRHDGYWVRQFFIHNAVYWLEEFHLDGLRLDAVHAIFDPSKPDILEELADTVRACIAETRRVHLVLENDRNIARYLERDEQGRVQRYSAQWNDDLHHALHVLLTGETRGYYGDYADDPVGRLGRCLTEGFAYQGEPSPFRGGEPRGEPSRHLPPAALIHFLQNHDQIGNRPMGERITELASPEALKAATALLVLTPSPPLLFMGQEWGSRRPFAFFCDFEPELAERVTAGRRGEFAHLPEFAEPESRERIPDPAALRTFEESRLDWDMADTPEGRDWLDFHKALLALRHREIVPRLAGIQGGSAEASRLGERGLAVNWRLGDGSLLSLQANFGPAAIHGIGWPHGRLLFALPAALRELSAPTDLPPWSVVLRLRDSP